MRCRLPAQELAGAVELVERLAAERALAKASANAPTAGTSPPLAAGAAGVGGLGSPQSPAPDMMALGTNYELCNQLTIDGKPLVMSGGGKWACLVSRRQFGSEEQLRSHITLSELYKTALREAIAAGKVGVAT